MRAWLGRQMMEEGEGRNEAEKGGRLSPATAAAAAAASAVGFVAVIWWSLAEGKETKSSYLESYK